MEPNTKYPNKTEDDLYEEKIAEEQDELTEQLTEPSFIFCYTDLFVRFTGNHKMKLIKSMGKLRKMDNASHFEANLINRIGFDASKKAEGDTEMVVE